MRYFGEVLKQQPNILDTTMTQTGTFMLVNHQTWNPRQKTTTSLEFIKVFIHEGNSPSVAMRVSREAPLRFKKGSLTFTKATDCRTMLSPAF
jgi:hypothetical protein